MTTIDAKADIEAQDMQSVLPVTFTDVSYTVQVKNPEVRKRRPHPFLRLRR
jgi:ATP-binding cassette, subfamily G (WHITE), member 2